MPKRILVTTLTLALAISATALAGPLNGKTYQGSAASTGVTTEGRRKPFLGATTIKLAVASNGKTVKVSFPASYVIEYCRTTEHVYSQKTKPASISGGGSFTAKVGERFEKGPGEPSVTQTVSGRFSGSTVKGTIHTEVAGATPCSGSTTFSAHA